MPRARRPVVLRVLALALALAGSAACARGATDPSGIEAPLESGDVSDAPLRRLAFVALDGSAVTSATLAGRMTFVLFASEADPASTVAVRFLREVVETHAPRINALLLMLDPAENRPLVEVFASFHALSFPVVLADADTIAGQGPFPGLHHVPSTVLLDRGGREVWRHVGLSEKEELESALRHHE